MSVIDTLITDRVTGAKYNASDLNRVGEAVAYVADRLRAAGIEVDVHPRTNWTRSEPVKGMREKIDAYRDDIDLIRTAVKCRTGTPAAPSNTSYLSVAHANNIEKILVEVDALLTSAEAACRRCGAAASGASYYWGAWKNV